MISHAIVEETVKVFYLFSLTGNIEGNLSIQLRDKVGIHGILERLSKNSLINE